MPGPYELYLIRHGIAEERGDAWPDDGKRPLSAEGMTRMRKSMRGLAGLELTIDVILTSPLVRTRQTAEIVAAGLEPRPPIIAVDSLAPGGSQAAIVSGLEKQSRKTRRGSGGHGAGIGERAARLIGSRHAGEFKKGAICRIDVDELPPSGPGELRWFLTPKILRALKK